MNQRKELKAYKLSAEAFDMILSYYHEWVVKTKNFEKYVYGSKCKSSLIWDGGKKIMCRQCELNILDGFNIKNNWIQCICYREEKQVNPVQKAVTGGTAWRTVKAKINKHYSETEFAEVLNKHSAEYDHSRAQLHFTYVPGYDDAIYEFKNCVKYDINGAYAKALCDIFPKAKDEILKIYNERKTKPENKALINYFVGMLCKKNFRKTFNWIVQRVRKQMEETIIYTGGILLYANTDGYAVSVPDRTINTTSLLGDFKLEYSGDIQIYSAKNYWVMQAGESITGTALYQVRNKIDLRNGIVVDYDRFKEHNCFIPINVKQREVQIKHG